MTSGGPTVAPSGAASSQATLSWNTNVPVPYLNALQTLANDGDLSGVPPQILSYIMEAESGPSYQGGGWNGIAGGWFGLEAPDIAGGQATIVSQSTFNQQAQAAAAIYAKGLTLSQGDPIAAENYYQTGKLTSASNGAKIFESFGLLADKGYTALGGADPGAALPANPFPGPVGAVAGLATGGTSAPSASNVVAWADSLGTLLSDLTSSDFWKRIGLFAAGVVLVIGGLVLFISTTKTGQKVTSDAGEAAMVAAVA